MKRLKASIHQDWPLTAVLSPEEGTPAGREAARVDQNLHLRSDPKQAFLTAGTRSML